MSHLFTKTQVGPGKADPIMLDHFGGHEVSLQVSVYGAVTYTVRSTLDDLMNPSPPNPPVWFDHPDLTNKSVSLQANYAFKPRFIELEVLSGSGKAVLTVLQAD